MNEREETLSDPPQIEILTDSNTVSYYFLKGLVFHLEDMVEFLLDITYFENANEI